MCNNDALIAAQLAGIANFGYEELTPVAQLGTMSLVLIVREDSPYQGLRSLLEAAKKNPNSVRFGADIGSPAYFYAKELEETAFMHSEELPPPKEVRKGYSTQRRYGGQTSGAFRWGLLIARTRSPM